MPPQIPIRTSVLRQLTSMAIISKPLIITVALRRGLLPSHILNTTRTFTHSLPRLKKKSRADREREEAAAETRVVEDPFDFTELKSGIEKAVEKLKIDLSKLRTGGRFNPELIENLRVKLEKGGKQTERLGDLAQVLPKGGRMLMVLVGEKDHVHPVISAIQGARDINLQPQPDPHSQTQLNIPIPPPTKESRDQALAAASKTGDTARTALQSARSTQQKRFRAMELNRVVRPDDLKKAHKEMEKSVEKATSEVKKTVEAARKTMEQV